MLKFVKYTIKKRAYGNPHIFGDGLRNYLRFMHLAKSVEQFLFISKQASLKFVLLWSTSHCVNLSRDLSSKFT